MLHAARNGTIMAAPFTATPPIVALSVNSRVGVYEVVAPIGAGGMGEVYRARDTRLKRDVAL